MIPTNGAVSEATQSDKAPPRDGSATLGVELLVFDLDGTLIDSSADLCASVDATLRNFGRPLISEREVKSFIGDGAGKLVERALAASREGPEVDSPLAASLQSAALTYFLDHYRIHKLDKTRPYPGVLSSLHQIRQSHPDLPMAVLTNKPTRPSREICDGLGLSRFFFAIYGADSFPKKTNPEGLQAIIAEAGARRAATEGKSLHVSPGTVVMVGDSPVDVQTARLCGTRCLGCSYGLTPELLSQASPDLTAAHADQWAALLGL